MQRRDALKLTAMGAAALAVSHPLLSQKTSFPIIDAHIHLFDPTRPGGVPWPTKDDTALYKPALPDRYAALSKPFGVVGAIAIEASPLDTDNEWLLHEVEKHPIMVGMIGDLIPSSSEFHRRLDTLHANRLFLGIRYGNLWNRDLMADLEKPGFVDGLKALSEAGLVFECANPDPRLIRAALQVSERVPDLRIVMDHMPNAKIPDDEKVQKEYWANLKRLAESPQVYVKLSEIPVVKDRQLVQDAGFYAKMLDPLWNTFGEDHVLFGSDWPNSDHVAPYAATFDIVRTYMVGKSQSAQEKYYWRNSVKAYRWQQRKSNQTVA
ncbi:MAG: amidohydrolase family protein [Acidobacteriota bacterium]|nr:amidohydrolase family protein [Acidobacteriota bacterium]